jgi:hypothetical protein
MTAPCMETVDNMGAGPMRQPPAPGAAEPCGDAADAVGIGPREPVLPRLALPDDRLWTQREAAYYLGVSVRYLRQSNCPKLLLPGTGAKQQPLLRYEPQTVKAWAAAWRSGSLRRAS